MTHLSMRMSSSERLNIMVEQSHTSDVPFECVQAATSTILVKEVEACKSGSTCKVTARLASRAVGAILNSGVAAASVLAQSPLLEPMGYHSDEKINEPDFPSFLPKGELSSDGADCHSLKPCDYQFDKIQPDKFEVHLSETCQRRFVMFDQSGSKKRIFFHPSMVHEFPALLQSPLKITNSKEPTENERTRSVGHLRDILVSPLLLKDSALLDTILPPGWRSTLLPSREEDAFRALYSTVAEGFSRERVTDCLSKENTEDLDALLWSDDGMSSEGHSPPSDLTWSYADSPYSACVDKKRKAFLEAETDSTATSRYSTPNKVFCSNSQHLGRGSGYGKEVFAVSDLSSADEESSIGSTNCPRQQNEAKKRPAKKSRKDTIHSTLQLLRSIVPGGESMDTAHVLGEAVQYVKTLQVEVKRLEGNVFL